MTRGAPTKTHHQMVEVWKQDTVFMTAYDELEMEFTLLRELLLARQKAGLTQAEVAEKMGTKATAITRLERALSDQRHSPTIATLKKYAQAVGCRLEVHLISGKPVKISPQSKPLGLRDTSEAVTVEEAFPGYGENPTGMALRVARRGAGLTQRQLAEIAVIPQRHISKMETGKRQIGKEEARKLAEALHVSDFQVFL